MIGMIELNAKIIIFIDMQIIFGDYLICSSKNWIDNNV